MFRVSVQNMERGGGGCGVNSFIGCCCFLIMITKYQNLAVPSIEDERIKGPEEDRAVFAPEKEIEVMRPS